jgi:hypothetical protein
MSGPWMRKWLVYRWEPVLYHPAEIWAAPGEVLVPFPDSESQQTMRPLPGEMRGHAPEEVHVRQANRDGVYIMPHTLSDREQRSLAIESAARYREDRQNPRLDLWMKGPLGGFGVVSPSEGLIYDTAEPVDEETEADERSGHANVSGVLYGVKTREVVVPLEQLGGAMRAVEPSERRMFIPARSGTDKELRDYLKRESVRWRDRWRRAQKKVLGRRPATAEEQDKVWDEVRRRL